MPQIPLFPLGMALFPSVTLPLRIFEQRYLRLVAETLKTDSGFGVALIRNGREVGRASVWPVGLTVQIVDWSQGEEGLLHIQVRGGRRFRILETHRAEDGLLIGDEVEWLPDEPARPVPANCDGLLEVLRELKQHAAMLSLQFAPVDSADALSWQLAQLLPLEDRSACGTSGHLGSPGAPGQYRRQPGSLELRISPCGPVNPRSGGVYCATDPQRGTRMCRR